MEVYTNLGGSRKMADKEYLDFLKEGKQEFDEITITLRDYDNQLIKFLEAARSTDNPGHSFPVTIDKDDKEHEQDFYFDGDGAFYIKDIKLNGQNYKGEKK